MFETSLNIIAYTITFKHICIQNVSTTFRRPGKSIFTFIHNSIQKHGIIWKSWPQNGWANAKH